jgi:hypothetical protein
MIDVCKLKFEIYYCHPYEFRHNLIDTCQHVKLFVPKGYFTACCGRNCLAGIELRKTEQELLQINVSLINLVYFIRKQDIVFYIKILSQTDSSKLYTGLYTTRAPEKTNMCRRQ